MKTALRSYKRLDSCDPAADDQPSIITPMPGLVADIIVVVGDDVTAGQTVEVLEAVKLFTDLTATPAGRIARVAATRGETVATNALILSIEPTEQLKR